MRTPTTIAVPGRCSPRMRGSSLVEMIFAMAIIGLTLAFATLATVLIARESMRSIAMLPAENRAQITMDKIRFTLQRAQFRTIVISDNNQRIEFLDPYLSATVKSAIYLSNGRLYYQPSVTVRRRKTGAPSRRSRSP